MNPKIYTTATELGSAIDSFKTQVDQMTRESPSGPLRFQGICGFDGFIDTFIRMEQPATMAEFGPKVTAAAGIAASYASTHQGDKFGGNGPLLASAISDIFKNQIDVSYIGAMGDTTIMPIFQQALEGKIAELHTLAAPAHSDCLEFEDGKIMLCDMRSCAEITWERLLERVGQAKLDAMLQANDFIAAVNWGKLPHVGDIWKNLAERLKSLGKPDKETLFFMDLAEFEQRPLADRSELLSLVATVTEQCRTILSLNLKEAWQMADTLGGNFQGLKEPKDVAECAAFLRAKIEADRIIVHPNDGAACASAEACVYVAGPYCKSPLISTGAGDNFGAGCLAAALLGMDDLSLLLAGNSASGHFVRSGESASFQKMSDLLEAWQTGTLAERL
jgi:hypothetical protein